MTAIVIPSINTTLNLTEEQCDKQKIEQLPILILYPHNRCNCRCIMCDIWKIRETRQLQRTDLEPHLASIRLLGVRWAVLSGGEPLLHDGIEEILSLLRAERIRITLLSTGLLLRNFAALVANGVEDIIVSLDGPPSVHNAIRRIPDAFALLQEGVMAVRHQNPAMPIHARCTIQKSNYNVLAEVVETAKQLKLDSISFLAADTTSVAFNRLDGWNSARKSTIHLDEKEIDALTSSIDELAREQPEIFSSHFIKENPEKLHRIADHFRSRIGLVPAVAPLCNAPWVSSVIEADGTVRPCFFHPPIGNLKDSTLLEVLNNKEALRFRANLNVATDPICRNCVCSLHYTDPSKVDQQQK